MKIDDWAGVAGLVVIFAFGFWIGTMLHSKETVVIEKNVTIPIVTEKLVFVNNTKDCNVCVNTERIIEKTLPCPECKCNCYTSGAWKNNGTAWWYDEYRPETNASWKETP